jgi:hypothetical protein
VNSSYCTVQYSYSTNNIIYIQYIYSKYCRTGFVVRTSMYEMRIFSIPAGATSALAGWLFLASFASNGRRIEDQARPKVPTKSTEGRAEFR